MQDNHTLRGCKTPPSSGNLSEIVNPWNSLAACSALAHYKHLFEITLATSVQRMPCKKFGSISLKDLWQFVQNPCTHGAVFHIHPKQGNSSKTYVRQIPCRYHKTSQSPMVTQSPGRLLLRQVCPKLSGKVCLAGSLAGSLQSHRGFSEFHNICTDATLLVVSFCLQTRAPAQDSAAPAQSAQSRWQRSKALREHAMDNSRDRFSNARSDLKCLPATHQPEIELPARTTCYEHSNSYIRYTHANTSYAELYPQIPGFLKQ